MIKIDGSIGEGGGQVLRVLHSAFSLDGESVAIKNVRSTGQTPDCDLNI